MHKMVCLLLESRLELLRGKLGQNYKLALDCKKVGLLVLWLVGRLVHWLAYKLVHKLVEVFSV